MATTTIFVCNKRIKAALGVYNHYFIVVPSLALEIHPGKYFMGTHHTLGFTRSFRVHCTLRLCDACSAVLLEDARDMGHLWYYPYINCETLTRGLLGETAISYQTVGTIAAVLCVASSFFNFFLLFVGLVLIVALITTNNCYFRPRKECCEHLLRREQI